MTEERLENIRQMEDILNKTELFVEEARELLEKWQSMLVDIQKLDTYYGSDQWMEDFQASNDGKIPSGVAHGVLSEDLAYNALSDNYFVAVDFLKLVTKIIAREQV